MTKLTDIINYRRINDLITTSGQPSEAQLSVLKADGVTHVVNLGPHWNKGALPDETASLAALNIPYTYIPVDFNAPTDADFEQFCAALDTLKDQCNLIKWMASGALVASGPISSPTPLTPTNPIATRATITKPSTPCCDQPF